MSFVDLEFPVFLTLVLAAYWALPSNRGRNLVLLVASAVFYGWVHPWFLCLLYGSAVLDYVCGQGIARAPRHRRAFLVASLAGNLGMLGYFKYCDFFLENVVAVLGALGIEAGIGSLDVFLPVGISFFTFQTMSYTIDVYRGVLVPRSSFLDYAVFVSFFPQLVAGPIERARTLLPQVEAPRRFDARAFRSGLTLALWGAFKKVCIADQVSPYVDLVFVQAEPSSAMVWAATLGFTLQILTDFSGYTDIARGTARMLGFEILVNFRSPYLAVSPSDFWRRWHVSFSSWIRDYLYIPLGGSRGGRLRTLGATFGAMLLSGLWHGASWNFVLWGAYHALILTLYRAAKRRWPAGTLERRGGRAAAVALMFGLTVLGWLFFRETDVGRIFDHLARPPFGGTREQATTAVALAAVTAFLALPLVAAAWIERAVVPRLVGSPWLLALQTQAWAVLGLAVFVLARTRDNAFIYFQF